MCVFVCAHIQQCNRVQFLQGLHWSGISEVYEGERGHLNRCDALSPSLVFLLRLFLISPYSSHSSDSDAIMTQLICDAADVYDRGSLEGGG